MNANFLLPGENSGGTFVVPDRLGDIPVKFVESSTIYLGETGLLVLTVMVVTLCIERIFR